MHARNQYLKEVRLEYGNASKVHKSHLLDEAGARTHLERKYLMKKLKMCSNLDRTGAIRRARKATYGHEVTPALARCWHLFDHPCGQRLAPLLREEVQRLRAFKELSCSDAIAKKLTLMSPSTIDRALTPTKEAERLARKYHTKIHPLLYQKVPVKVFTEQDRLHTGAIQIDCVEHCGASAAGEFLHTLSTTDIATGWWEGGAIRGRGQERTLHALAQARTRYPFPWHDVHSDNGTEFINWHLYRYCEKEHLTFSRSRPYKKNDNCLVEQKNGTHVRKCVGYLRHDTEEEMSILNDLYGNELRLFKNFFQPVMKLISKERVRGKIHRKYDMPQTPYQRVMASAEISEDAKQNVRNVYESLNPAALTRGIQRKLDLLYHVYQMKQGTTLKVEPMKKLIPATVSFFMTQPKTVSVSS